MNTTSGFKIFFLFLWCIMSCLPPASQAADKVVVIPLFGHGKPLKNIITVAKANGMFTDPVAAVNSITDASENNPYLVVIGPGVYTLTHTLVMKPWVDITGSGENVTRLVGAISGDNEDGSSAIVQGASRVVISDLTINNTGGGAFSLGIYNEHISKMKISRIIAQTSGGLNNYSIDNYNSGIIINDVTALASGGQQNTAIINNRSPIHMKHVTATATGDSSSYNNGIFNIHCNPYMTDITSTALDGLGNCGVRNDTASPLMVQVYAKGYGGANNYGVFNQSSICFPNIRRSTIFGTTYAVMSLDGPGVTILSQSTVLGGSYVYGNAFVKCIACDDNDKELGKDCK